MKLKRGKIDTKILGTKSNLKGQKRTNDLEGSLGDSDG